MHIKLITKYRGWTIKVVSFSNKWFEWVVSPATSEAKNDLEKLCLREPMLHYRGSFPRTGNETLRLSKTEVRRSSHLRSSYSFKGRSQRIYDPTSMPTLRGNCSALWWGKEAVENMTPENKRVKSVSRSYCKKSQRAMAFAKIIERSTVQSE